MRRCVNSECGVPADRRPSVPCRVMVSTMPYPDLDGWGGYPCPRFQPEEPPVECSHPLLVDDVFMSVANRDGGWRCDTCAKTFVFLPADVVVQAEMSATWGFDALESLLRHGPPETDVGLTMYMESIARVRRDIAALEEANDVDV